jgi:hypothetical protein
MRLNLKAAQVLASILLLLSRTSVAQTCDALLAGGVFDVSRINVSESTTLSYLEWFCDERFSEQQQAESVGASIGLPFKGLPLKLGFDSSKESWQSWYEKTCSQKELHYAHNLSIQRYVQQASQSLLQGFNECINADGLHVWLERTTEKQFKVAARFRDPGSVGSVSIQSLDIPKNVECKGTLARSKITGSTRRVPCTRLDDEAVQLTLNANWDPKGGGNLTLPAVWHPPEYQTKTEYRDYICKKDRGQASIDDKIGDKHVIGFDCEAPGTVKAIGNYLCSGGKPCDFLDRVATRDQINGRHAYVKFKTNSSDAIEVTITIGYLQETTECVKYCEGAKR